MTQKGNLETLVQGMHCLYKHHECVKDRSKDSVKKRWTQKINIFERDFILVPVHMGQHWCLAVINMRNKEITTTHSVLHYMHRLLSFVSYSF